MQQAAECPWELRAETAFSGSRMVVSEETILFFPRGRAPGPGHHGLWDSWRLICQWPSLRQTDIFYSSSCPHSIGLGFLLMAESHPSWFIITLTWTVGHFPVLTIHMFTFASSF